MQNKKGYDILTCEEYHILFLFYKDANVTEKKRSVFEGETRLARTDNLIIFLVAMRLGETHVPIPNTTVKT